MDSLKITDQYREDLAESARELLVALEAGNTTDAYRQLGEINRIKDKTLYHEIGKMTRALHSALVNFSIDAKGKEATDNSEAQQILSASDRLQFVIKTTEDAANKTMDMVEDTVPISENLGSRARELKETWARLIKRELSAEEFRALYGEMENFLDEAIDNSDQLNENLNNILLAQDFQDITGQVIKKVISIVSDVQDNLVELVKLAATLQSFSGDSSELDAIRYEMENQEAEYLEGPIINKDEREDVVANQDDVATVLPRASSSSAGFTGSMPFFRP